MKNVCVGLVLSVSIFLGPVLLTAERSNVYNLINSYTLGGKGGWDSITFDKAMLLLIPPHTAHVNVVNADTGAVVGDISGLSLAHDVY